MAKIRLRHSNVWEGIAFYGAENKAGFDKFCAFLLAISPILQHYIGLFENAGFTVLLVAAAVAFLRLISKHTSCQKCLVAMFPLLVFEFYTIFNRSFTVKYLLYGGFMMLIFLAVSAGCINIGYVIKYATKIAQISGIVIFVQYLSYYLLRYRIRPVPTGLLLDESVRWSYTTSGKIDSFGKLYRPSAFFLEPSHMFLYLFPIICLLLLLPNVNKTRIRWAIFLSAAMLMSTSGMGIAVVLGLWLLYLTMFYKNKNGGRAINLSRLLSIRSLLIILGIIVGFVVAFETVDIFRNSITRIFYSETGSTAIDGRVRRASNIVKSMRGKDLIFGFPNSYTISGHNINFSGYHATLFKRGIVGIVLSYFYYGQGLLKLKDAYFWLTFVILIISFFTAHTHGTFYMLYYAFFLTNGYFTMSRKGEATSNSLMQEK